MKEIYIGRQPIFDREQNVFGYELLFRRGNSTESQVLDGDEATKELLLNIFSYFAFDELVGGKPAFVNFTTNLILNPPPLPPDKVVIEVLEDVLPTQDILDSLKNLAAQGFTLALDDVVYHEGLKPFFELVNVLKVDLMGTDKALLPEHVKILKQYPVKLLAEKVETYEEFEFCKKLGFDLFQGFFLSKPRLFAGKRMQTNKVVVMNLIAKLQNPSVKINEVELLLSQDPVLSFKLLKIINSAAYARPTKVESLQKAVILLGLKKLKEWVSLIVLTSVDDKPSELIKNTMIRAKMCQLLAIHQHITGADAYFTTGLFSSLDAIMDQPIQEILDQLPVQEEIKAAILDHQGQIGSTLHYIIEYEKGNWVNIPNTEVDSYRTAYVDSIKWAGQVYTELKS
ncbi:MAG: EAL and HDOD domain-containing protein [Gammaproteobacteria bacterium]